MDLNEMNDDVYKIINQSVTYNKNLSFTDSDDELNLPTDC